MKVLEPVKFTQEQNNAIISKIADALCARQGITPRIDAELTKLNDSYKAKFQCGFSNYSKGSISSLLSTLDDLDKLSTKVRKELNDSLSAGHYLPHQYLTQSLSGTFNIQYEATRLTNTIQEIEKAQQEYITKKHMIYEIFSEEYKISTEAAKLWGEYCPTLNAMNGDRVDIAFVFEQNEILFSGTIKNITEHSFKIANGSKEHDIRIGNSLHGYDWSSVRKLSRVLDVVHQHPEWALVNQAIQEVVGV